MGPRIFIRGNGASSRRLRAVAQASMGPRIFIRGNSAGATDRSGGSWLQWGRGSSSAETKPRRRQSPPARGLQWGRGSSSAETAQGRQMGAQPAPASMGPRIFIRGNNPCHRATARDAGLQWGRGSSSAETWRRASLISWRSGFNGAADLHPRKRIDVRQTRSPQRCFNGAADLHPRKPLPFEDAAACPYASMGPRIFIRGNSRRRGSGLARPGCFNGAADLHPRKPMRPGR